MTDCLPTIESLTFREGDAREWDAFLARTPGGSYPQTSLWAVAKMAAGYRARRFTLRAGNLILGGAQLLIRPLPIRGSVAYVPLGPVIGLNNPELPDLLIKHLQEIACEQKISYLIVQAPRGCLDSLGRLQKLGFSPSVLDLAPTATLLIDLSKPLDQVLASMRKGTRYGIKASQRKGIRIREGCERDLPVFHRLLVATANRQRFSTFDQTYLAEVWRLFSPNGHIKMFVAEFNGEPVSALLAMSFGDTVTYWKGCWSGKHGSRGPNEGLQWTAIQWAKSQGCRYYDFGGIDRNLAKSILSGDSVHDSGKYRVAFFKLGFGGQVELFPESFAYIHNPVLRRVWHPISKPISELTLLRNMLNKLR